jgi:hypothetical protein
MRDVAILSNILWERILLIRKKSCMGCIFDHFSPKYHDICLSYNNNAYFYTTALNTLLFENIITNQEKQMIENKNLLN